jgi:hypothetical protein
LDSLQDASKETEHPTDADGRTVQQSDEGVGHERQRSVLSQVLNVLFQVGKAFLYWFFLPVLVDKWITLLFILVLVYFAVKLITLFFGK